MKKKIIVLLLALTLLLSLFPTAAAADVTIIDSGTDGTIEWSIDSDYTLTISGSGEMKAYNREQLNTFFYVTTAPWKDYYMTIKKVVVESGVTSIGYSAFYGCIGITSVVIQSSVVKINNDAFCNCASLYDIHFEGNMPNIWNNSFSQVYAIAFYPEGNNTYTNLGSFGGNLVWLNDGIEDYSEYDMVENGLCGDNIRWRFMRGGKLKISGSGEMDDYTNSVQFSGNFKNCISSIEISDGITYIGAYSFYTHDRVLSVSIGNSVKEIGLSAFDNCIRLKNVIIPASVEKIDHFSLAHCYKLNSIVFNGKTTTITSNAFASDNVTAFYYLEDNWTAAEKQNYGGITKWRILTRHALDEENLTVLPASPHPYPANYSEQFVFEKENAFYITLKFSDTTMLGASDILVVKDINNNVVASYTGAQAAGQTVQVEGEKAVVWLNADDVGEAYGFSLDSVTVSYLKHVWNDEVISPTCAEQGYTKHTCEVCGEVSRTDYVDALGHEYIGGKCTKCGEQELYDYGQCGAESNWTLDTNGLLTISGKGTVTSNPWISADADKYANLVKTVVVSEEITSLRANAFSGCTNLTRATFEGDAVSLDGNGVFTDVSPDFEIYATKGNTTWTDSGAYNEQSQTWNGMKIVFINGHDHIYNGVITTPAGCLTVGVKTLTCSVCGHVKTEFIEPLNHDYEIVVNDPCCGEDGFTTHTCKRCGETYKSDYIVATGHNFKLTVVAPTCTSFGYTLHICTCGVMYSSDPVAATGHTYGAPELVWNDHTCLAIRRCDCGVSDTQFCDVTESVVTPATEEAEGLKTFTATILIDGKTYTSSKDEVIAKVEKGGTEESFGSVLKSFFVKLFDFIIFDETQDTIKFNTIFEAFTTSFTSIFSNLIILFE